MPAHNLGPLENEHILLCHNQAHPERDIAQVQKYDFGLVKNLLVIDECLNCLY